MHTVQRIHSASLKTRSCVRYQTQADNIAHLWNIIERHLNWKQRNKKLSNKAEQSSSLQYVIAVNELIATAKASEAH